MKKIVSILSVFALLLGMCMTVCAAAPVVWVVEPVYDAIYSPGTTKAPYFAFEKDGVGGYMDSKGNEIITGLLGDMSASAFCWYSDKNAYAMVMERGTKSLLSSDGTRISDTEAFLAENELLFEDEIIELITKEEKGTLSGTKTVTYKDVSGKVMFSTEVTSAGNFHSGVATAQLPDGTFGFFDKAGNFAPTDFELDMTGFYYEDLCIAKKGNKYGLVALTIYPEIAVRVDGNKVYFDQLPAIVNDRTLVPLRAIFEALGATVSWDGATRTVTGVKGDIKVNLTIDSDQLYVNGTPKTIDVPAMIINDRTMVPARAISEALGCFVDWDAAIRTVKIITK